MLGRDILASMYRMRPDGAVRNGAVRSDGGTCLPAPVKPPPTSLAIRAPNRLRLPA
jgi:hypothetical protein